MISKSASILGVLFFWTLDVGHWTLDIGLWTMTVDFVETRYFASNQELVKAKN